MMFNNSQISLIFNKHITFHRLKHLFQILQSKIIGYVEFCASDFFIIKNMISTKNQFSLEKMYFMYLVYAV